VDAIVVIDTNGRIESVNRSTERLFDYTPDEIRGQQIALLVPGETHLVGASRQVIGRRKEGGTFPIHLSVGEMTIRGERKFTGILHDLTKRVSAEEQLREQASLVRIGEMAAVLAHEIKNPLAGIRGAIEIIAGRTPEASKDKFIMREIVARIDGLNNLMKDLLLYARPPRPAFAPADLLPIISATVALLKSDPAMKEMDVTMEGGAPAVDADAEFLKIVFVNLLTNASQAMQGRGAIRVSLRASNGMSEAVVQDSGPGIPPNLRDKIFTPFFTTKTRGSGLGLATCKRLIEAHNGSIALECPPDGGTIVVVRLPSR
jgi:signal transduction histidine kinase